MVLRRGLALAAVGVAAGLGASLMAARLLGAELYGVSPTDPVTMGAAALVLLSVTAAACWLPASAATRVDPVRALKAE